MKSSLSASTYQLMDFRCGSPTPALFSLFYFVLRLRKILLASTRKSAGQAAVNLGSYLEEENEEEKGQHLAVCVEWAWWSASHTAGRGTVEEE